MNQQSELPLARPLVCRTMESKSAEGMTQFVQIFRTHDDSYGGNRNPLVERYETAIPQKRGRNTREQRYDELANSS